MQLKLNQIYTFVQQDVPEEDADQYYISQCEKNSTDDFYNVVSGFLLDKDEAHNYLIQVVKRGEVIFSRNSSHIRPGFTYIGEMWHREEPEVRLTICVSEETPEGVLVEYTGQPIDAKDHPGQIWNAIDQTWKWI